MSQLNFKEHILSNSVFDAVVQAAKDLNIEGYVVGGYVRDLILKRPSKDIDFVCVGSGIDWALKVSELIPYDTHVTVFNTFGTAQIKAQDWELITAGQRVQIIKKDAKERRDS